MKCRQKYAEKPPSVRNSRRVVSPASPGAARRACARRWNRGTSPSIRRYAGRPRLRTVGNSPRAPSAPAYSKPVSSSRTDIDISDGWVATPISEKSRSRVG